MMVCFLLFCFLCVEKKGALTGEIEEDEDQHELEEEARDILEPHHKVRDASENDGGEETEGHVVKEDL